MSIFGPGATFARTRRCSDDTSEVRSLPAGTPFAWRIYARMSRYAALVRPPTLLAGIVMRTLLYRSPTVRHLLNDSSPTSGRIAPGLASIAWHAAQAAVNPAF